MSALLTDFLAGGQRVSDAVNNYASQSARYLVSLNRRLAAGEITQSWYDGQVQSIRDNWPDGSPDGQVWDAFKSQVASDWQDYQQSVMIDIQAIPGTITGTATDVGNLVGTTAGNLLGGTASGLTNALARPAVVVPLIIFGVIVVYLFKQPIVRNAKIVA